MVIPPAVRAFLPLLSLSLLLTACTAPSKPPPPTIPLRVEFNEATWSLPLDAYLYTPTDRMTEMFARDVLMAPCIEDLGFSWPIARFHPERDTPVDWDNGGRGLFDLAIASEFGYGAATTPGLDAAQAAAEGYEPTAAAVIRKHGESAFGRCTDQADATLDGADLDAIQKANLLSMSLTPHADDADARAEDDWRTCMVQTGLDAALEAPLTMDRTSAVRLAEIRNRNGSRTGTAWNERTVAKADAACRRISGYSSTLYRTTWDLQVEVVTEHFDELELELVSRDLSERRRIVARTIEKREH